MTGSSGVTGANKSWDCLTSTYAARGMVVQATWFKKKLINQDTRKQDNLDTRSMTDHAVLYEKLMQDILDLSVQRKAGG